MNKNVPLLIKPLHTYLDKKIPQNPKQSTIRSSHSHIAYCFPFVCSFMPSSSLADRIHNVTYEPYTGRTHDRRHFRRTPYLHLMTEVKFIPMFSVIKMQMSYSSLQTPDNTGMVFSTAIPRHPHGLHF
jgi:hypothetical protein